MKRVIHWKKGESEFASLEAQRDDYERRFKVQLDCAVKLADENKKLEAQLAEAKKAPDTFLERLNHIILLRQVWQEKVKGE